MVKMAHNLLSKAKQSKAKQSKAKQSKAKAIIVPFLRLAAARRLKLNTTFVMDNRRI